MTEAWAIAALAALCEPKDRTRHAAALATQLGVEDLLIFTPDEQLGVWLPAPGFAQTLVNGRLWHACLDASARDGVAMAHLALPGQSPAAAVAYSCGAGAIFMVRGGSADPVRLAAVRLVMPLLAATLHAERGADLARALAHEAHASAMRAAALSTGLAAAQADAQHAYRDLAIRATEADAARRRAEQAVQERQNILAVVSHDLKNPLSSILLSAELLTRGLEEHPKLRRKAEMIQRAGARMSQLVSDLLDSSAIEAGALSLVRVPVPVSALVEEAVDVVQPLLAAKLLRLDVETLPVLEVVCDRNRIIQVFSNLLGNAIAFSPEGGTIVIAANRATGALAFSVADQGPGVAPALRDRLFDRFVTGTANSLKGSGLGLFIARGIVEAHGGQIWLDSTTRGATVCFTVPGAEDGVSETTPLAPLRF